jgi:hypothetical protein
MPVSVLRQFLVMPHFATGSVNGNVIYVLMAASCLGGAVFVKRKLTI